MRGACAHRARKHTHAPEGCALRGFAVPGRKASAREGGRGAALGGRRAVFRPLLRRAAYACGKGVILRCKAVQHAKNRADVRKTEGTGKSGYRGEAVRTVILGAVRGHAARVCGDCRYAGRMYRKAQAGRQGAGSMDGQGWKAGLFCVWVVRRAADAGLPRGARRRLRRRTGSRCGRVGMCLCAGWPGGDARRSENRACRGREKEKDGVRRAAASTRG